MLHERYMIIKQLESMLMVLLTIFAKSNPSPNLFLKNSVAMTFINLLQI